MLVAERPRLCRAASIAVCFALQAALPTAGAKPLWCADAELRNVAMSVDGRWLMMTTPSSPSLSLFDADLNPIRTYSVATRDGKATSVVYAVYDAPVRRSFIVVLQDIAELWEVSYDPKAEPIYDGLVHDYRMGEAIAKSGFLGVRRVPLKEPLRDLFFDASYRHAVSISRNKPDGKLYANVTNLDVRRSIGGAILQEPVPAVAGFTVTWNSGTVTATHGPAESKKASDDAVRRYCAP